MTTMNTGAASLSDERERAAITACALMIKGICLTRPNAEWTGAIEDRIQFMLKQMQAGAAIAAVGAQEPIYQTCFIQGQWRDVDRAEYDRAKGLRSDLARIVYAARAASTSANVAQMSRDNLQDKSLAHGFKYWRAPDAHGITGTIEQAKNLIADLVGVEVEITNETDS